ncbi:MAG: galactokinase family protein [Victivallales bacterium]|nr:galactokinase family protein [Eubacteriales bacterium]
MKTTELIKNIRSGAYDANFVKLYGKNRLEHQRERYINLAESFASLYGEREIELFSVPGRSEILGNHTDHNNGKVIAAALDIDIIAVASRLSEPVIKIKSAGYRESVIELAGLCAENAKKGNSCAMIAGVADYFIKNGHNVGGYCAYTTSDVLMGSGISSSAAFEVMVGNILNFYYNNGSLNPVELAKAGKYAENEFFGKPCGLMDQAACAVGGFCYMDFADQAHPFVEKLSFDPATQGYSLCLINTGGNHAKLTEEYASLPKEMKDIASYYSKPVLRTVNKTDFLTDIPVLREKFGDRAVLRALHYFEENDRVEAQRKAIKENDFTTFFLNVVKSGNSSFKYLQNVFCTKSVEEQGLSVALALCDRMDIISRVHGGGFAGTVQAWVKTDMTDEFSKVIESVFGKGSLLFLNIRPYGAVMLDTNGIYQKSRE